MRHNHEGMPEILSAYEKDGSYFGIVQVEIESKSIAFEFGVDVSGYRALRRVLQERPFETTAASPYRYFFVGSYGPTEETEVLKFEVRIEQGREGKQFPFKGPPALLSNLFWFQALEDLTDAAHLRRVVPSPGV